VTGGGPGGLAGGGVEGDDGGFLGAGSDDEFSFDEEGWDAGAPGEEVGLEVFEDIALPDDFTGVEFGADEVAEGALEVDEIVLGIDDGGGAWGVGVIDGFWGVVFDGPEGEAGVGVEAAEDVAGEVGGFIGGDEEATVDGDAGHGGAGELGGPEGARLFGELFGDVGGVSGAVLAAPIGPGAGCWMLDTGCSMLDI
jgi:hypothetical protein